MSGEPLVFAFLIRPLSFVLTPVFLSLGVSANQVTYLGCGIGVVSLVLLAWGTHLTWILGFVFFVLQMLMDAIDGNLARMTNSATYLGKFLDGLSDMLLLSLVPGAVGLGLYIDREESMWLLLGAANSLVILFSAYFITRYSFHREWLRSEFLRSRVPTAEPPDLDWKYPGPSIPSFLLFDFLFIGLLAGAIFDLKPQVLIASVALSTSWGILTLWNQYHTATRVLKVPRISRHATTEESRSKNQDNGPP